MLDFFASHRVMARQDNRATSVPPSASPERVRESTRDSVVSGVPLMLLGHPHDSIPAACRNFDSQAPFQTDMRRHVNTEAP